MFKKTLRTIMTTALAVTMMASNMVTVNAAPMKVNVADMFDAEYYAEQNPDLKAAFGNDFNALLNHYLTFGMKEGRNFTQAFDLMLYKSMYPDLVAAFGDNWELYVTHYLNFGINEKRDGGGAFDIVSYMANNPDVVDAFGFNFAAIKNHYETFGKAEGRVAISPAKQATVKAAEASKKATVTVTDKKSDSGSKKEDSSCSGGQVEVLQFLKDGDAYYNYTEYMKAITVWESEEPIFADYFDGAAYDEAVDTWRDAQPQKSDFIFAYEDESAAQTAFEEAHTEWEANAPVATDYLDEEAYDEAYAAYVAENPEPVVEDYPYFPDGYSDEEAARLAWQDAYDTWSENAPAQSDFIDEDAYNNAVAVYESAEPQVGDYVYYENTYESADAAAQAYTDACTAWEEAKATALEGLTPETDEYNTALEEFLAGNPEPSEGAYEYHENEYESAEDATQAYNDDHAAWVSNAPVESDFEDEEAYNEAVTAYAEAEPKEDVYQAKVNEYESQDAATQAFTNDHIAWEEAAPEATDYLDAEEYAEAVNAYNEEEPQEEDFVSVEDMGEGFENTYTSAEEADAAYEAAVDAWETEMPSQDDFAGNFYEERECWAESCPDIEDFEVAEEDIPEGSEIFEPMN